MTTEIAKKLEFILSGRGTSKEEFNEIIDLMEEYKQLTIPVVVSTFICHDADTYGKDAKCGEMCVDCRNFNK